MENIPSETRLTDYWQVLSRRRWVVLSFFIICSATVTLGTFLMTPLYRASTTMLIEGENTNVLNATDSTSETANFNIFENYIETQIAVIKSDKIAGKVAAEFKLDETPRYQKKVILGKTFQRKFTDDIKIERLRDTRMIEISVYNPDAKLSADIANRLADIYSQDNLMRRALTFIRNQRMASLNADFLRLQSKLDSLSNIYGPKHPEMIALKDEIRALADRIKNEGAASEGTAAENLSEDQKLLEETLLKLQENSVLSSSKMNNIALVDRAVVPKEIAKPKRLLNIFLGIVLGLVGGALLAFLVDYLDDTLKIEEDAKKNIEKHVFLGSLLHEKVSETAKAKESSLDRLVDKRPNSASAETYRLFRTRILWSISKDHHLKDLAVLSSMPGEGKTTIASNLAIALSQLNHKVLLVDTDIRKGRLHESYDLPNDKGLGQYLTDELSLGAVVQTTPVPGLSVVTCGKSVIDSSQLFSSSLMTKFIQESRAAYDMVIYDTPPLVVIADAAILISQVGGSILVTRSSVTSRKVLRKGLAIIQESHAHLIGVVLNDADSQDDRTYSHYYHAYQKS